MKKILLLASMVAALCFSASAQQLPGTKKLTTSLDTLTNTDTTTYSAINPRGDHNVTFYVKVTKLSGTVAGIIDIFASNDGGLTYHGTAIASDTITNTTGTKTYRKTITRADQMYKLQIRSSGTSTYRQESWFYSN